MTSGLIYEVIIPAAVLLGLLVVIILLLWPLTHHFVSRYQSRYGLVNADAAQIESDTRTAMVQLAVGFAGFAVLFSAIYSIRATNDNINLAAQGQLAERFSRAVALVAENDSREVDKVGSDGESDGTEVDPGFVARVGGVYALDSIVESGGDYYLKPAVHVLAAMIRRESPTGDHNSSCAALNKVSKGNPGIYAYAAPGTGKVIEPDVEAALKVVQRLAAAGASLEGNLDLSHTDLCIAFLHSSNFRGVQLRNSDLRGAILDKANLTGAALTDADFRGTHLPGANLARAVLWGAKLDNSDLSCADLSETDLRGATLIDANLSGANLGSAKSLGPDQLSRACYSRGLRPVLPAGRSDLKIDECGEDSMWTERGPLYTKSCPPANPGPD